MNKTSILYATSLLLALATPVASSHEGLTGGGGVSKDYCEDADKATHDYGPSTGFILSPPIDGSIEFCPGADFENPVFDGHYEFAYGGAYLLAGWGAVTCWGVYPDHFDFPAVHVHDAVLSQIPEAVSFTVAADTLNNVPPVDSGEPNCGDFETDFAVDCINMCWLGFPSGLDGSYNVFVNGVYGHVYTNSYVEGGFSTGLGGVVSLASAAATNPEAFHPHFCPETLPH